MAGYEMDGFFDLQPPSSDPYQTPFQPPQPSASSSEGSFYIAAKECHLVLDIEGGVVSPMTQVILWEQKEPSEAANQLWFNHTPTGTIRTNANPDLVLEVVDNLLCINAYQQGNTMQLWEGSDQFIRNRMNPTLVFQITGTSYGSGISVGQSNFSLSQHFEPIFANVPAAHPSTQPPQPSPQPPQPSPQPPPFTDPHGGDKPKDTSRRLFFLVSQMHGKVWDIRGANPNEGAEVIAYSKQASAPLNQLWYVDEQGLLHSALNHFVPTASGQASKLRMHQMTGGVAQMFKLEGNKITNGAGECVDVKGARKWDNTELITYKYNGDSNQHWSVEYV